MVLSFVNMAFSLAQYVIVVFMWLIPEQPKMEQKGCNARI
jgi:hypothetical protein